MIGEQKINYKSEKKPYENKNRLTDEKLKNELKKKENRRKKEDDKKKRGTSTSCGRRVTELLPGFDTAPIRQRSQLALIDGQWRWLPCPRPPASEAQSAPVTHRRRRGGRIRSRNDSEMPYSQDGLHHDRLFD